MDIKELEDPRSHAKTKFLALVDEGSKFVLMPELFTIKAGASRNATTKDILETFKAHWSDHCGLPKVLRHDAEGSLVSTEFTTALLGMGVRLDPCCTQARWQNGITERAIRTVSDVAENLLRGEDISTGDAVHAAVEAHNSMERVEGYAPVQWAFGRQRDWTGALHENEESYLPLSTNHRFLNNLDLRVKTQNLVNEKVLKNQIAP